MTTYNNEQVSKEKTTSMKNIASSVSTCTDPYPKEHLQNESV